MKYQAALQYLNSRPNYENKTRYPYKQSFGLERVDRLLSLFDSPHRKLRSIIVGGTTGKGSTAYFTYKILKEAGYKVGLFISPHIEDIRERIVISGEVIPQDRFSELMTEIKGKLESDISCELDTLTFFEILTALTIVYFSREKVDIGVFEVGMGGRLDATNILDPLISIITPIDYDHQHILGNSLIKIAKEKAGIIRDEGWTISGLQKKGPRDVIGRAKRKNLLCLGRDFDYRISRIDGKEMVFDFTASDLSIKDIKSPVLGDFQAENMSCAIRTCMVLKRFFSFSVTKDHIYRALRSLDWPGRLERLNSTPLIIADGAHNPFSIARSVSNIKRLYKDRKCTVIFGASRDKDIKRILKNVSPLKPDLIITRADNPRASRTEYIESQSRGLFKNINSAGSVAESLRLAKNTVSPDSLIFITGSFYLVGEAKKILKERGI